MRILKCFKASSSQLLTFALLLWSIHMRLCSLEPPPELARTSISIAASITPFNLLLETIFTQVVAFSLGEAWFPQLIQIDVSLVQQVCDGSDVTVDVGAVMVMRYVFPSTVVAVNQARVVGEL